ncbi:preprotein translocase subunit SecA [Streptomyces sp. NPDC002144]
MDARSAIEDLRRRAAAGETLEALSHAALAVLGRPAAAVGGVAFDDEARQMALRLTSRTMIHGGRTAGEERLRGARYLAGSLHVLADGGVHMITPDERQAEEEGKLAAAVYSPLGITVSVLHEGMDEAERSAAYSADVTVGTYRRFALDLLHDRQAQTPYDRISRGVSATVVTDPGHVLIAPIAEPSMLLEDDASPADALRTAARLAATLDKGQDYAIDTERALVRLTSQGRKRVHDAFGVTDTASMQTLLLEKRIAQALAAANCYTRGRDYDLAHGTVTPLPSGALPGGVRLRGGLLQAIETKEGVTVTDTQWITATISVFEYVRRYSHVGGTSLAPLMFTTELEELFNLTVWDRREADELRTQQQHAPQMAAYLALNRQIAQWSRLGAQQRTELYGLRERSWQPDELQTLLHRLVDAAVTQAIGDHNGDLPQLRRSLGALATDLLLEQPTGGGDTQTIADQARIRARAVCDDHLTTDPDRQRRALHSALDQAAVYQAQAEMHYRDLYWPDHLAPFEEALSAVYDNIRTDVERAVARQALHPA